jgi:hypothetical protein
MNGVRTPAQVAENFTADTAILRVSSAAVSRALNDCGDDWLRSVDPAGIMGGDGNMLLLTLALHWKEAADDVHHALTQAIDDVPATVRHSLAMAALDLMDDSKALQDLYYFLPPEVRKQGRAQVLRRAYGHSYLHGQTLAELAGAEAMERASRMRASFRATMDTFVASAQAEEAA